MNRDSLRGLLIKDEGLELRPYFDCCGKFFRDCKCEHQGKLTIGTGRNIEDVGISDQEAGFLLENDMSKVVSYCREAYPWFNGLDDSRQNVVASMVFNMGPMKFSEFKKMIAAVSAKDFSEASNQMLQSAWAGQVGERAVELADMMRVGDTFH